MILKIILNLNKESKEKVKNLKLFMRVEKQIMFNLLLNATQERNSPLDNLLSPRIFIILIFVEFKKFTELKKHIIYS